MDKYEIRREESTEDFIGLHRMWLLQEEAGGKEIFVSWRGFTGGMYCAHKEECMAFHAKNGEVSEFKEIACAYDLPPLESLAEIAEQLGIEIAEGE